MVGQLVLLLGICSSFVHCRSLLDPPDHHDEHGVKSDVYIVTNKANIKIHHQGNHYVTRKFRPPGFRSLRSRNGDFGFGKSLKRRSQDGHGHGNEALIPDIDDDNRLVLFAENQPKNTVDNLTQGDTSKGRVATSNDETGRVDSNFLRKKSRGKSSDSNPPIQGDGNTQDNTQLTGNVKQTFDQLFEPAPSNVQSQDSIGVKVDSVVKQPDLIDLKNRIEQGDVAVSRKGTSQNNGAVYSQTKNAANTLNKVNPVIDQTVVLREQTVGGPDGRVDFIGQTTQDQGNGGGNEDPRLNEPLYPDYPDDPVDGSPSGPGVTTTQSSPPLYPDYPDGPVDGNPNQPGVTTTQSSPPLYPDYPDDPVDGNPNQPGVSTTQSSPPLYPDYPDGPDDGDRSQPGVTTTQSTPLYPDDQSGEIRNNGNVQNDNGIRNDRENGVTDGGDSGDREPSDRDRDRNGIRNDDDNMRKRERGRGRSRDSDWWDSDSWDFDSSWESDSWELKNKLNPRKAKDTEGNSFVDDRIAFRRKPIDTESSDYDSDDFYWRNEDNRRDSELIQNKRKRHQTAYDSSDYFSDTDSESKYYESDSDYDSEGREFRNNKDNSNRVDNDKNRRNNRRHSGSDSNNRGSWFDSDDSSDWFDSDDGSYRRVQSRNPTNARKNSMKYSESSDSSFFDSSDDSSDGRRYVRTRNRKSDGDSSEMNNKRNSDRQNSINSSNKRRPSGNEFDSEFESDSWERESSWEYFDSSESDEWYEPRSSSSKSKGINNKPPFRESSNQVRVTSRRYRGDDSDVINDTDYNRDESNKSKSSNGANNLFYRVVGRVMLSKRGRRARVGNEDDDSDISELYISPKLRYRKRRRGQETTVPPVSPPTTPFVK